VEFVKAPRSLLCGLSNWTAETMKAYCYRQHLRLPVQRLYRTAVKLSAT